MAFRFPLTALLRVRQARERQWEILLHQANQHVAGLQRGVDDLGRALMDVTIHDTQELESGISAAELQFDMLRRAVLMAHRGQLQKTLADAETLRTSRRLGFEQARRDREVVETLRKQQHQLYSEQKKRQEQHDLDDLFLLRREFQRRG